MSSTTANNKRIAKNTLLLYFRMLFLMLISLYTSRVILQALGVTDYGIYNVVGGFVALFAVVSKSLSGAASRFLNYEMGKGNIEKLKIVFSSTVTIQILLALIIVFLAETIGLWFLNTKLVIPDNRLSAANWCFQFSIVTFCSSLITIPYNAAIIAHERMKAFAYVSIIEGLAKLGISYLIMVSADNRLVFYAILICLLQLSIQAIYRMYCKKYFEECSYHFIYDKKLFRQLLSYSSWGFIGSTSGILRNQGINILINLFFGPAINAARAVSNQVLHAVDGFVHNFIMAVRPQIVQSYAAGNFKYMNELVLKSARFSYFLFLFLSLPIILNCDFILHTWLTIVPEHSTTFVQLILVYTLITTLSHPLSIAQAATGKIRDYQLVIGGLQLLNIPVSYLLLKLGGMPECVLYVAITIAFIVVFVSIYMINKIMPFSPSVFCKEVLLRVIIVSVIIILPLILIDRIIVQGFIGLVIKVIICLLFSSLIIMFLGLKNKERHFLFARVKNIYTKVAR